MTLPHRYLRERGREEGRDGSFLSSLGREPGGDDGKDRAARNATDGDWMVRFFLRYGGWVGVGGWRRAPVVGRH